MRTSSAVVALLTSLAACGGASVEDRPRARSELDVERWVGSRHHPSRPAEEPGRAEAPIRLAHGETFHSLVALARTPGGDGAVAHCAVYSIRAAAGGLQEGRLSVPCPEDRLDSLFALAVPYREVQPPRSAHLRAALRGARPAHAAAGAPAGDRVLLRLTTDQGQVQSEVPQPRWPAPHEEGNERPRGSPPSDLAEVWEAVMYPGRYAARPHMSHSDATDIQANARSSNAPDAP